MRGLAASVTLLWCFATAEHDAFGTRQGMTVNLDEDKQPNSQRLDITDRYPFDYSYNFGEYTAELSTANRDRALRNVGKSEQ